MKRYYLHLTQDDFFTTDEPNQLRTDVIDLYNNSSYKNYSTTKSIYGLDLLGTEATPSHVWTGLNRYSDTETEAGIIDLIEPDNSAAPWNVLENVYTNSTLADGSYGDYISSFRSIPGFAGESITYQISIDEFGDLSDPTPAQRQMGYGFGTYTNEVYEDTPYEWFQNQVYFQQTTNQAAYMVNLWVNEGYAYYDATHAFGYNGGGNGEDITVLVTPETPLLARLTITPAVSGYDVHYEFEWNGYVFYETTKEGIDVDGAAVYIRGNKVPITSVDIVEQETFPSVYKFIDYTGRINVVDFDFTPTNRSATGVFSPFLAVYTDSNIESQYPYDFAYIENVTETSSPILIDSDRYAIFRLDFETEESITDLEFDFYLTVDIDSPIIAPLFEATTTILNKFPTWTEMYDDSGYGTATPPTAYIDPLATPNSLGGLLINSMSGRWIEELQFWIRKYGLEQYIGTADTNQRYYAYRTDLPVDTKVVSITGDLTPIPRVASSYDFQEVLTDEDAVLYDYENGTIYSNKIYTSFLINDVAYDQTYMPVWNWFDEFGMLVDLYRLPEEDNDTFKKRILDVYINKPGVSANAFRNAIRRELDLWYEYGATPDSNYLGATPEVYEISDLQTLYEGASPYVDFDGLPTDRFINVAKNLKSKYPILWDNFVYSQAYWDITGFNNESIAYLGNQYDATPVFENSYTTATPGTYEVVFGSELHTLFPEATPSAESLPWSYTFTDAPYLAKTVITAFGLLPTLDPGEFDGTSVTFDFKGPGGVSIFSRDIAFENIGDDWVVSFDPDGVNKNILSVQTEAEILDIVNDNLIVIYYLDYDYSTGNITSFNVHCIDPNSGTVWLSYHEEIDPGVLTSIEVTGVTTGDVDIISAISYIGSVQQVDWSSMSAGDSDAYQPGIGAGDDLFVYKPDDLIKESEFLVDIEVRGKQKVAREEYPVLLFEAKQIGVADQTHYTVPDVTDIFCFSFSIAGTTYYLNSTVNPVSEIDTSLTLPIEPTYFTLTQINGDNAFFDVGTTIYRGTDGLEITIDESNQMDYCLFNEGTGGSVEDSTLYTWELGQFDPDTQTMDYSAVPPVQDLTLAFWDGTAIPGPADYSVTRSVMSDFKFPIVVNRDAATLVQTWESTPADNIYIYLNGYSSDLEKKDFTLTINDISWPENLDDPPNKAWKLVVKTSDSSGTPSVYWLNDDESRVYLPITKIEAYIDDDVSPTAWVDDTLEIPYGATSVRFTSIDSADPLYPQMSYKWESVSATIEGVSGGTIDENGLWRNGRPVPYQSNHNLIERLNLTRDDFGLSNSEDLHLSWLGVNSSVPSVEVWIDTNTIKSEANAASSSLEYSTYIEETYDADLATYVLDEFPIFAKFTPHVHDNWKVQVHDGYVYLNGEERYLYVDPVFDSTTANEINLAGIVRRGAPVIVKTDDATPTELRQVAFSTVAQLGDTPELTLTNTEQVTGNTSTKLYAAYKDIYDIVVNDLTIGEPATPVQDYTESNEIELTSNTYVDHDYEISYKVNNSFYVDSTQKDIYTKAGYSKLVFDKPPTDLGAENYNIVYESSKHYPATPVDVDLNPFYTTVNEGFIYVTTTTYETATVEIRLNPGVFYSDSDQFSLLTVRAIDENGNPKPNTKLYFNTTFGTFGGMESLEVTNPDYSTVSIATEYLTTDQDGFAAAYIEYSDVHPSTNKAFITLSGDVTDVIEIPVLKIPDKPHVLAAKLDNKFVVADDAPGAVISGVVKTPTYEPVPYAVVRYRKARTIYDAFSMAESYTVIDEMVTPEWGESGKTIADEDGRFTIGPFHSATPGECNYWFVAIESQGATPFNEMGATPGQDSATPFTNTGDVVFWYEYPGLMFGLEAISTNPTLPNNIEAAESATPIYGLASWANPYDYDASSTPTELDTGIVLPDWYAIRRFDQYRLGLLPASFEDVQLDLTDYFHPDYKEF